nr:hypothetical protein KitaXyl93_63170 [Kitasatospora sp. Xyl93]
MEEGTAAAAGWASATGATRSNTQQATARTDFWNTGTPSDRDGIGGKPSHPYPKGRPRSRIMGHP